jgi:hypothetical protein
MEVHLSLDENFDGRVPAGEYDPVGENFDWRVSAGEDDPVGENFEGRILTGAFRQESMIMLGRISMCATE